MARNERDTSGSQKIEFKQFSSIATPITVHLKWEVSYEEDGAWFVIEKSINGDDWVEKSRRSSVGNHETYEVYLESISNFPEAVIEYFRLKRIDRNGNERVLDVSVVTHPLISDLKLYTDTKDVYRTITISFEALAEGTAMIAIYDASGRVRNYKKHDLSIGYNRRVLSLNGMEEGIYRVVVESTSGIKLSKRLVIYSKKKRKN